MNHSKELFALNTLAQTMWTFILKRLEPNWFPLCQTWSIISLSEPLGLLNKTEEE